MTDAVRSHPRPVILGVDPGAIDTGLLVVRGQWSTPELLADAAGPLAVTVTRTGPTRSRHAGLIDVDYLGAVEAALDELAHRATRLNAPLDAVAIEDVVGPHKVKGRDSRVIDPSPAVATGITAGAVVTWAAGTDVVTVMPGGNGHGIFAEYPTALHDPNGACRGGRLTVRCNDTCAAKAGTRRHMRSAFDVARKAVAEVALTRRVDALDH